MFTIETAFVKKTLIDWFNKNLDQNIMKLIF